MPRVGHSRRRHGVPQGLAQPQRACGTGRGSPGGREDGGDTLARCAAEAASLRDWADAGEGIFGSDEEFGAGGEGGADLSGCRFFLLKVGAVMAMAMCWLVGGVASCLVLWAFWVQACGRQQGAVWGRGLAWHGRCPFRLVSSCLGIQLIGSSGLRFTMPNENVRCKQPFRQGYGGGSRRSIAAGRVV